MKLYIAWFQDLEDKGFTPADLQDETKLLAILKEHGDMFEGTEAEVYKQLFHANWTAQDAISRIVEDAPEVGDKCPNCAEGTVMDGGVSLVCCSHCGTMWKLLPKDRDSNLPVEGEECPNCHNGTIEKAGNELRCRGECGMIMPICEECDKPFDDNPGFSICKTCSDWETA